MLHTLLEKILGANIFSNVLTPNVIL